MSAYWVSAGVFLICWWSIGQSKIQHRRERYTRTLIQKVVIHCQWGWSCHSWTKYCNHTASDIMTTNILESFPEGWKYKTHQLTTSLCADGISMNTIRHFGIKLLFCWLSEHRQVEGKNGFIKPVVLAEHWLLLGIPLHKNEQVLRNLCLPFIYGETVSPMPRQRGTWICSE